MKIADIEISPTGIEWLGPNGEEFYFCWWNWLGVWNDHTYFGRWSMIHDCQHFGSFGFWFFNWNWSFRGARKEDYETEKTK